MADLGWRSVALLELTALPTIDEERWVPLVREADVLLVSGGDVLYLSHWMRESGFTDLPPSLTETVWVGCERGEHGDGPGSGRTSSSGEPPSVMTDARDRRLLDLSRTSRRKACRASRWPRRNRGRPGSTVRRMGATTTRRPWWPTGPSSSSPRALEALSRLAGETSPRGE